MSGGSLADAILDVWFGTDEEGIDTRQSMWWSKDEELDAELARRFGEHLIPAAAGRYADWERTPEGALALVVLLDQFSRNIHRGRPASFAQDPAAREVVARASARGLDRRLPIPQRAFLYMPWVHSEQDAHQARALAAFENLEVLARPTRWAGLTQGFLTHVVRHAEIIHRFGRYPHRNEVLGRETTPEEAAFLEQPNASF